MITIQNLSYKYGSAQILQDISLTIPRGGITALVGPNGAGKSTLLNLVARLLPLQSGQITVDDLTIGSCSNRDLARKLAILPQVMQSAPRLSVRELIGCGRYPHNRGRQTALDHQKVDDAIALFDLQHLADRPLESLSGGQRQKASVAMTYAQDTDYVLLDEPLNNLDIAASRQLMQNLRGLARDHDRTIVVVLHDLSYACSYADTLITLKDGALGPCGHPLQIVDSDLLQSVFSTDATVHRQDGTVLIQV